MLHPALPALSVLVCAAVAAQAEVPGPEYFTGVYERVGRTGEASPALLNDLVRLETNPDGNLAMRTCDTLPPEPGEPLILTFDAMGDVPNLLSGRDGPFELWCQYFNDHDNYPVLTCASEMGARFTLWAAPDADCPMEGN